MNKISRKQAKELGLKKYYTGSPCKHGHVAQRYVNGFKCTICANMDSDKYADYYKQYRKLNSKKACKRAKDWCKNNPDRAKKLRDKSTKKYRSEKRDHYLLKRREYYVRNIDRERSRHRKYRDQNRERVNKISTESYHRHRDKNLKKNKIYKENNKPKFREYQARRRLHTKKATPKWANLDTIRLFYECCPDGCHVDHIIPLRGKNVCGLHVENNLQWLPIKENLRKHNKMLE